MDNRRPSGETARDEKQELRDAIRQLELDYAQGEYHGGAHYVEATPEALRTVLDSIRSHPWLPPHTGATHRDPLRRLPPTGRRGKLTTHSPVMTAACRACEAAGITEPPIEGVHDDFCEAEYVGEAGGFTSCSCSYRAARGLIAAHDAQVVRAAASRATLVPGIFVEGETAMRDWLNAEANRIEEGRWA